MRTYVATGTQLEAASALSRKAKSPGSSRASSSVREMRPLATSCARSSAAPWKPVALIEGTSGISAEAAAEDDLVAAHPLAADFDLAVGEQVLGEILDEALADRAQRVGIVGRLGERGLEGAGLGIGLEAPLGEVVEHRAHRRRDRADLRAPRLDGRLDLAVQPHLVQSRRAALAAPAQVGLDVVAGLDRDQDVEHARVGRDRHPARRGELLVQELQVARVEAPLDLRAAEPPGADELREVVGGRLEARGL